MPRRSMVSGLLIAFALGQTGAALAQQVYGPAAPPGVQQPMGGAPAQPAAEQNAPFILTPQETAQLDAILNGWQQASQQISTFECEFTLWEYNVQFPVPPDPQTGAPRANLISTGQIKYARPDKGYFEVQHTDKAIVDPATGALNYMALTQPGEHWVCDGKALYEKNATKKQVIERPLPPSLRGKQIADGPLPFVFGADAAKLKQRYWMRVATPQNVADQIWLEAFPRWQQDTANYQSVLVILDAQTLDLVAVKVHEPGGNMKTYQLKNPRKNAALARIANFLGVFVAPRTPLGWQYVVEEIPADEANTADSGAAQPGTQPPQAQRPLAPFLPR